MATTITKQVLENGFRNYIALFTIASDGTTETMAAALDPTSSGDMGVTIAGNTLYPNTHLKLWELRYNLGAGMNARLVWEATSPQDAWDMYGFGNQKFLRQGGIYVPQSGGAPIAGATGKIDLVIPVFTPADGETTVYGTVQVWAKKDVSQNDAPVFGHQVTNAAIAGVSAISEAEAVTFTG